MPSMPSASMGFCSSVLKHCIMRIALRYWILALGIRNSSIRHSSIRHKASICGLQCIRLPGHLDSHTSSHKLSYYETHRTHYVIYDAQLCHCMPAGLQPNASSVKFSMKPRAFSFCPMQSNEKLAIEWDACNRMRSNRLREPRKSSAKIGMHFVLSQYYWLVAKIDFLCTPHFNKSEKFHAHRACPNGNPVNPLELLTRTTRSREKLL